MPVWRGFFFFRDLWHERLGHGEIRRPQLLIVQRFQLSRSSEAHQACSETCERNRYLQTHDICPAHALGRVVPGCGGSISVHGRKILERIIWAFMSVCTPKSSSLDVQPCSVGWLAKLLTIDRLENRLKTYVGASFVEEFSEKVSQLVRRIPRKPPCEHDKS